MEKEKIFENHLAAADEKRMDSAFLPGYFDLTFLLWSYNIEESILTAEGEEREKRLQIAHVTRENLLAVHPAGMKSEKERTERRYIQEDSS